MMISAREKKEGREEGRQEEGTEEERSGQMKGGSRAEWLPALVRFGCVDSSVDRVSNALPFVFDHPFSGRAVTKA